MFASHLSHGLLHRGIGPIAGGGKLTSLISSSISSYPFQFSSLKQCSHTDKGAAPSSKNVSAKAVDYFIFLKIFIYLFFRKRGREGERWREISMCGHLSDTPYQGPGLQPRHVPALTGNRTSKALLCKLALNPLSQTSQGSSRLYFKVEAHVSE